VVYRLPNGMSLATPGSHCPGCKKPIRWRDNVPILGWLLLRGRCRDCKTWISFRYPLVEAIMAVMFLAVGTADGFTTGVHAPLRPMQASGGFDLSPEGGAALLTTFHVMLLSTLLAGGLIQYDRYRVPWRLMLPALVVGGLTPLVWPQLRPIPAIGTWVAWAGHSETGWPGWLAGLVDGAMGMAVGTAVGLAVVALLGVRTREQAVPRSVAAIILGPACIGLFLGWQAAGVLGFVTLVLTGAASIVGRKWPLLPRLFPDFFLAAAALAWILTWNDLVRLAVW
jgi:leader peptidase (prepilin peptidase) / N-methyltransferase